MGNEASVEMNEERVIQGEGENGLWSLSLHRGVNGEGEGGCVFTGSETQVDFCLAAVEHLRLLRHPNIIKFLGSDSCSTSQDRIQLFTEPLVPVSSILVTTSVEGLVMGWRGVANGLGFLHDKAGISHNNLDVACVYVNVVDSQWKVGGFEAAYRHRDMTPSFLSSISCVRYEKAVPPEDKVKSPMATNTPPHSRDVWAFGQLMLTTLEKTSLEDQISDSSFQYISDELLNPDPSLRPTISTILSQPWMSNQVSAITEFISKLTLKKKSEKDCFFLGLMEDLHTLPPAVIAEHIVPLLVTPLAMVEPLAREYLWKHFLLPVSPRNPRQKAFDPDVLCPLLSSELFKAHVIPLLLNLMECRDYHVRFILLDHLEGYISLCSPDDMVHVVLPEVLLGLKDQNDELVEATLHALGALVPHVGADAVIGTSRKHIFINSQPRMTDPNVETIRAPKLVTDSKTAAPTAPPISKRQNSREDRLREMKEKREQQRLKRMEKTKLGHVTSLSDHMVMDDDSDSETAPPTNYSPSISHDEVELEGLGGSDNSSQIKGESSKVNLGDSKTWVGTDDDDEDWGDSWSDMDGSAASQISNPPVSQVPSPPVSQVPEAKPTLPSSSGKKLVLKLTKGSTTQQNRTSASRGSLTSPQNGPPRNPGSGGALRGADIQHLEEEQSAVKYEEEDLFADMVPNIKPSLNGSLATTTTTHVPDETPPISTAPVSNALQYQPEEVEATGDWGTENWNDDF